MISLIPHNQNAKLSTTLKAHAKTSALSDVIFGNAVLLAIVTTTLSIIPTPTNLTVSTNAAVD